MFPNLDMPTSDFILFPPLSPEMPWCIGMSSGHDVLMSEVPTPPDSSANAVAPLLAEALRQKGYQGSAVALAIPSTWCMAAKVSLADLPRHDTQALLYRLEEQLPLPAESLVADFVLSVDNALGVCARVEEIRPWVLALEPLGIAVQSIAPAAFLAAQTFAGASEETLVLLLAEEGNDAAAGDDQCHRHSRAKASQLVACSITH